MRVKSLIPTCLLAAALPLSAASISVNFGADRNGSAVDEAGKTTGAIPVAGTSWNNTTVNGSGFLDNLVDDSGTATTAFIDWTANNTWQSASTGATDTSENGDLTRGYLDDGGGGWTLNLSSPYLLNDIYVVHATDQGDPATMSAVSVNGTYYKGDGTITVLASGTNDSWQAQNWTNVDTLAESNHYLKVLAQPGVSLRVDTSSPGRGAIAGLQVEDAYTGTLSYWDLDGDTPGAGSNAGDASGNWADANWSPSAAGDAATANWTSGHAAVFSAGSDADGTSTITLAGEESVDAVWVQQGKVTLTGGTLALGSSGILRGDDPTLFGDGLVVDSILTGTDVTTVGNVTLNNADNAITGTVTILGETVLGANNTWGQLVGAGILDLQDTTLTAGDASDSNFGGEIFGDIGSGFVKTGTGTLTVGGVLAQLDAVTISDGALALSGGGSTLWTLSGSGNLDLALNGTLVIESTGNTGFSGKTSVTGGILRIPGQDTLGSTPGSVVADSITLGGGAKIQGGALDGADLVLDANRGITLAGGTSGFHTWTGFTTTVNGNIAGTGDLASHDGGTLIVNGDVNITGSLHTNSNQPSATIYNSSSLIAEGGFNLRAGTTTLNVGTATLEDIELGNAGGQAHQLTQVAGDVSVTNDIRIGHWGGATSVYTMEGGSLTQPDTVTNPTDEGQANLFLGIDGTGEFYLKDGTLSTTSLVIDGRGNTDGDDIFAMTGGTLNMGKWGVRSGNAGGTYLFQLGGGTVTATADWSSNLIVELTGTNGDVTFAPDGHTIELSGTLVGAGGLVKTGSGTLALTGPIGSYAGTTQVNAGTLQVGSDATGSSPVTIASGAAIGAGTPAAAGVGTVETLNLADGSTSTFRVGGPESDQVVVFATDGLTVAGTHTINILPVGAVSDGDTFTVIDYDGTIQGAGIAGISVAPLPNPHYALTVVNNTVDTTIEVVVDFVEIAWTGATNGTWDLTTSNWANGGASNFYESDVANFNDLDPAVSIMVDASGGAIAPAAMKFNNTTASTYTISGDAISGPGGLIKTGDGTVVFTNDNTYTGLTDIQAGTLKIGDGGTSGSISGGLVIAPGTAVEFSRSDDYVMSGQSITGGGLVVQNGPGMLELSNAGLPAGSFDFDLDVADGTSLTLSGGFHNGGPTQSLGTVNVGAGSTLVVNTGCWAGGSVVGSTLNVASGATVYWDTAHPWGYWGSGTMNITDATLELRNAGGEGPDLSMTGGSITGGNTLRLNARGANPGLTINASDNPATIACPVRVDDNPIVLVDDGAAAVDLLLSGTLSASALIKRGEGLMEITGENAAWAGGVDVQAGTLRIDSLTNRLGTGYLALKAGTVEYTGTGNETATNLIWIDAGGVTPPAPGTFDIVDAGAVLTLNPAGGAVNQEVIKEGPGRLVMQGAITGDGSVTANAGRIDLDGSNTYTGDTTVNAGATIVMGFASLDDGSTVNINGSGVIDLDHGVNDTIGALIIDGVEQASGTWGATGSGADNIDDVHFAGTGTISVGGDDYGQWAASFGLDPATDGAPGADADQDGLTNEQEYAFGLSPIDPTSVNPVSAPLDKAAATFSYTRRDPATTGLGYLIQTSVTLEPDSWQTDAGATQNVVETVDGVQTVEVTLTGPLGDKIFVQVLAN